MIVAKDKTAYDTFYSWADSKTKNALAYPVDVEFYDSISATTPSVLQEGIAGKSICYQKDASGIWFYDEADLQAILSDTTGVEAGPGYKGAWVTLSGSATTEVTKSTTVTLQGLKVYLYKSLIKPTVTGTLNDEYYTDADGDGVAGRMYIDVPDNQFKRTPYSEVGVNVEHPLLRGDVADGHYGSESDGYVYFEYMWWDIAHVDFGGNSSGPGDGPRKMTWPFQNSGAGRVEDDSIPIRDADDLRDINLRGEDWYEVVIIGYYVDGQGNVSQFYKSCLSDIAFGQGFNVDATDRTAFDISVSKKQTKITFDLNAGNINGNKAAVVWDKLYDNSDIGYAKLGDYPDGVPEPTRDGYQLVGWLDESTGTTVLPEDMNDYLIKNGTIVTPGEGVMFDNTFVAQWSDCLTVTYKYTLDDGANWQTYTGYSNQSVAGGVLPDELLTPPAENPSINGYTFDGWYTSSQSRPATKWDFDNNKSDDSNITLYGYMDLITYDIAYELNGGSVSVGTPNPDTYHVQDLDITLNIPTKQGYQFNGWAVQLTVPESGNIVFDGGAIKEGTYGDLFVTANWLQAPVTVTFKEGYDANESYTGLFNEAAATLSLYDGTVAYPMISATELNPSREGYTFKGWKQIDKNINWKFSNDLNPTMLTLDNGVQEVPDLNGPTTYALTLTAQWEINTYKVTFDSKEANESALLDVLELELAYGNNISDDQDFPSTPSKAGNHFIGWQLPSGDMVDENTIMPAQNVLLTAVWSNEDYEFDIIYEMNGGTNSQNNPGKYQPSQLEITLEDPTREGYEFAGWEVKSTTPGNGAVVYNAPNIEKGTYGDLTISASWTAIPVHILYYPGYGNNDAYAGFYNELAATTGVYGGEVTYPVMSTNHPNPTREGYVFDGWVLQSDKDEAWTFAGAPSATVLKESNGLVEVTEGVISRNYRLDLEATWKAATYNIIFDSRGANEAATLDGLSLPADFESKIAEATNFPADPTKPGYSFDGWELPDGSELEDQTMPAHDVVLKAKWISTGTGASIMANDFSHNYDIGGFTDDYTRAMGGVVVYDEWGAPTGEIAKIKAGDVEALNAARNGLGFGQSTTVPVTFVSAVGDEITVTATIYRGAAPEKPDPEIIYIDREKIVEVDKIVEKEVVVEKEVTVVEERVVTVPEVTETIVEETITEEKDGEEKVVIQKETETITNEITKDTGTETEKIVETEKVTLLTLFDSDTPRGSLAARNYWSILSVILVILGSIITLLHLIFGIAGKKKDEEEESEDENLEYESMETEDKRKRRFNMTPMRMSACVIGILAIIILLVVEDFTLDPAWINRYTIIFVIMFIGNLITTLMHNILSWKKKSNKNEYDDETTVNS